MKVGCLKILDDQNMDRQLQQTAKEFAIAGGDYALTHQAKVVSDCKGGDYRDVVTNIDLAIDAMLRERITEHFPDHGFHSEESHDDNMAAEYVWAIDPIDGTSNYARNIPHYSCCVSVLKNKKVIVSAIYNPVTKECFEFGEDGQAYCNSDLISVSDIRELKHSYVNFHPGRKEELREWAGSTVVSLLNSAKKTNNLASSGLDLCFLAAGRMDVVIYGTLSTMDIAGAIAIVRASGGEVYNYDSREPVDFSVESQRIIATSNLALLEDFFRRV